MQIRQEEKLRAVEGTVRLKQSLKEVKKWAGRAGRKSAPGIKPIIAKTWGRETAERPVWVEMKKWDGRSETKGQRPHHSAVTAEKGKTQHLSHVDTAWNQVCSQPRVWASLTQPGNQVCSCAAPSSSSVYWTTKGNCKETWNMKLHRDTAHASFLPQHPSVPTAFP